MASPSVAMDSDLAERQIEIHLPVAVPSEAYWRAEAAITAVLGELQTGTVDGNEVGMGEYVIFVETADAHEALDSIVRILRTIGLGSGAYAVVNGTENRETVDLDAYPTP